jgi:hypothetical protein
MPEQSWLVFFQGHSSGPLAAFREEVAEKAEKSLGNPRHSYNARKLNTR